MTTEPTTEATEATETEATEEFSPGDLRRFEKENRELKAQLAERDRKDAFAGAGIDPTAGAGKLLWESYDGEATAEAVKAKAEEYGIGVNPAAEATTTEVSQVAQAAIEGDQKLDQLRSSTTSVADPGIDDEIKKTDQAMKEAHAKGDFTAAAIFARQGIDLELDKHGIG